MGRKRTETVKENGTLLKVVHLDVVKRVREREPDQRVIERMARLMRMLGDPTRLRIALALRSGEMCVSDLAALVGLSDSAVSHQLRKLRDASLVRSRREGVLQYYRLDDNHIEQLLATSQEHAREVR